MKLNKNDDDEHDDNDDDGLLPKLYRDILKQKPSLKSNNNDGNCYENIIWQLKAMNLK